jgi:predicted DNA-binding transcriptional regulator AlpA
MGMTGATLKKRPVADQPAAKMVKSRESSSKRRQQRAKIRIAKGGDLDDLMLIPQVLVADLLDKSTMSLWNYRNDPKYSHYNFPRPVFVGQRPMWRKSDLAAWIASLPSTPMQRPKIRRPRKIKAA